MSAPIADLSTMHTALDSPATVGFTVSPNDSTDLASYARALFVGNGGDVKVNLVSSGDDLVFENVPDCTFLPIQVKRVHSTGTTASGIIGLR